MPMHCDNQSAIYIVKNSVFMKRPNTLRLTDTLSEMLGWRKWLCFRSHYLRSS